MNEIEKLKDKNCNENDKILIGPLEFLFNFISVLFVFISINSVQLILFQFNWIELNSNQLIYFISIDLDQINSI